MTLLTVLAALLCLPVRAENPRGQQAPAAPGEWALDWAAAKPEVVLAASEAEGTRQLYVVDVKRERRTRVTDEPAGVRWGALSPDGRWVVFLRDRSGSETGQLYKVSAAGGKAELLISDFAAKSIIDARWGSSGRGVYFAASDRSGYGIYQYALGANRAYNLYFSTNEITDVAPSEDEGLLAFAERSQPGGGVVLRIVDLRNGGNAGGVWLPLGSRTRVGRWAREGDLGRILVASEGGGRSVLGLWTPRANEVVWLQTGVPGDAIPLDWFPGGKESLLLQNDQGRTGLWRLDASSGPRLDWYSSYGWVSEASAKPVRIEGLEGRVTWGRSRPDGAVWADIQSSEQPPQVVEVLPGRAPRPALSTREARPPASGPKAAFVAIDLPRISLSGWLTAPAGGTKTAGAAVIWLPESPGTFLGDDWDPLRRGLAEAGLVVLALNPRGSAGSGRAAEELEPGEPGRVELDDLSSARDWLIREAGVHASSVAIAGRFYGGFLALRALEKQPELWAAGLSIDGIADWAALYANASERTRAWSRRLLAADPEANPDCCAEYSPISMVDAVRAPILLAHAEDSPRSPLAPMQAFAAKLDESGRPHGLITFKGGRAAANPQDQLRLVESFLDTLRQAGLVR